MAVASLSVDKIRIDGGTQARVMVDESTVSDYKEAMAAGTKFPSIIVFKDPEGNHWLADGFQRLAAWKLLKRRSISADVRPGTQREAILFSVGANATHGLRRTNADKRKAVRTLLEDAEWGQWSNAEIARRTGTSDQFVANVRAELQQHEQQNFQSIPPTGGGMDQEIAPVENGGSGAESDGSPATQRIYTHPKTGQPTQMNISNMGGGTRQAAASSEVQPDPLDEDISGIASVVDTSDEDTSDDKDNYGDSGEKVDGSDSVEEPSGDAQTTDAAQPETTKTAFQRIERLPLMQALKLFPHAGTVFGQQAAVWYENEDLLSKIKRPLARSIRWTKGPITDILQAVVSLTETPPEQWEGCPACKGSLRVGGNSDPCQSCTGGFTTRVGEGVTADAVRERASTSNTEPV